MSVSRMQESILERKAEGKCLLSDEEISDAARKVGYGAVKYFDLKQHPESDYAFSYDKMLDTKGNTAVGSTLPRLLSFFIFVLIMCSI
jgi:arginyl-tRNA synthetase